MSGINYISFPKALRAFLLSDIKGRERDFGITYDVKGYRKDIYLFPDSLPDENAVIIVFKNDASFNKCFKNKFIYEFCISIPIDLIRQRTEIAMSDLDDEVRQCELKKLDDTSILFLSMSLYDFIQKHLEKGEFAEIYRVWTDHVNFNFDSPKQEVTINLNDLLSPFDAPKVVEFISRGSWSKYTIVK
ncbi:MAG: hypothetical protein FWC77_08235 [Defluviitaleaceae bacterium]|nr:hypothetical protein [Defluviitaleaceae bacterium]